MNGRGADDDSDRALLNRYVALTASLCIEFCAGTAYAYGTYSDKFKDPPLNFSQSQVNGISAIGNVGMYLGIAGGLFHDSYGPQVTCLCGALMSCLGYVLAYLNSNGDLGSPNSAIMTACFALAWQGSAWLDCSAISLTVANFPKNRGAALGLCKAFFGLSGAIIGQLYVGFHLKNQGPGVVILLVMAIIVLVVGIAHAPLLRKSKTTSSMGRSGAQGVQYGYIVVIVLAAFLSGAALAEKLGSGVDRGAEIAFTSTAIILVLALWGIPYISTRNGGDSECDGDLVNLIHGRNRAGTVGGSTLASDHDMMLLENDKIDENTKGGHGENEMDEFSAMTETDMGGDESKTLLQALQDPCYWLLALAAFAHTGTGLMIINNIAQIAEAIQGHKDDSIGSLFVIIIGTVNAYGRMVAGYASDSLAGSISRSVLLAAAVFVMAAGSIVFAFSSYWSLYVASTLCAFAYGCYWSLCPSILADLYGTKNFGTIYNTIAMATAAGGLSLNAGIASYFYDKNADAPPDDGEGASRCYGTVCYKTTFIVCSALCTCAGFGLLILDAKIRGRRR